MSHRLRGLLPALLVLFSAACSPGAVDRPRPPAPPAPSVVDPRPAPSPQLPGGGRRILPDRRLVGFSGAPNTTALGPLTGNLDQVAQRLSEQARAYTSDRPVLPTFELLATRATSAPGPGGKYRSRAADEVVRRYLAAARRAGAVLLLGIQPGRADFLEEVRYYRKWLTEPDVGLALDPEWAVGPNQVPGRTFGSTSGQELEAVADYTAGLVREHNLPQKPFVYHQLSPGIVRDERMLTPHPGLALIKSVDGIGSPGLKIDTWKQLTSTKPPYVAAGFKLFYEEDTSGGGRLMRPEEVLGLRPEPSYVLYE